MSKKKISVIISFILIILFFCIGLIFYFMYLPMPIVNDAESCKIVKFAYNSSYEKGSAEFTELSEFNEQEVLMCLSNYKEKKTFIIPKGYSLNNYQFVIYVDIGNELKSIYIGCDSFSCLTYASNKYQILDDENLKNDLLKIMKEG